MITKWETFKFWAGIVALCAMMAVCVGVFMWGITYDPHRGKWIEHCQRQSPTWNCHNMYRNQ